jgi:hypothetical protein
MDQRFGLCILVVTLLLTAVTACVVPPPRVVAQGPTPRPESSDHDRLRLEWVKRMHRAGPGVDWQRTERDRCRNNLAIQSEIVGLEAANALAKKGAWRQRVVSGQTGRTWVTAVAGDGNTLLIGAGDEAGGIFSGTIGSNSWTQHGRAIGTGVHQVVVVPAQPEAGRPETWTVVANDGEGKIDDVYVSDDQGATWNQPGGLPDFKSIARVLREPGASRTVYLLAVDGASFVVCHSDDGGLHYSRGFSGKSAPVPDMWMDRVRSGPLYLLAGKALQSSSDKGTSFSPPLGSLSLSATSTRLRLVGSEAGAPYFYAVAVFSDKPSQLFVSDGGKTWTAGATLTDFNGGDAPIGASMSNPRVVVLGGVNGYRSTDAGSHVDQLNDWHDYYDNPVHKLHADLRGVEWSSYHGIETLFIDTDGGTYMSTDLGATVVNVTQFGMLNGEYYSTLSSKNNPELIAVGSEDQGLQQSRPVPPTVTQLISGDSGHLTSSAGDHNRLYGSLVGEIAVLDRESPPQNVDTISFPDALFVSPSAMTEARAYHAATLIDDGTVLITGGTTGSGTTNTAELFDPAAGTFTSLSAMTSARTHHTATLLQDGAVLIVGGQTGASTSNTAELFDPTSKSFRSLSAMLTARADHTATLLQDGTVLIAGGTTGSGSTDTVESFDPATGTFTSLPAMTSARAGHTATLLTDGSVLIAGGQTGASPSNTAELFDAASKTFASLPAMTSARAYHTATLLQDGRVLIAGGKTGSGSTSTAELFDPAAGTFTALSSAMTSVRAYHTATILPSAKVLMAGGDTESGPTNTVDVFDPAAGTFTLREFNNMATPRGGHTATLLRRALLIAGGVSGSRPASTAELGMIRKGESFLPYILADPADAEAVYLTGDPLLRLKKDSHGGHWTAMPQDFSGGKDSGDYLTALAISPVDQHYWYAASSQGHLWYSNNQGASWKESSSGGPIPPFFYGTALLPSPAVAKTCFVGGSGGDGPAVYKTANGGMDWEPMGLPKTLVLGLAFDDPLRQNLYAAAMEGAYVYDQASATWMTIVDAAAPLKGYWSVEGIPALKVVRFGTFGQGIWDYTPPGP